MTDNMHFKTYLTCVIIELNINLWIIIVYIRNSNALHLLLSKQLNNNIILENYRKLQYFT